MPPVSNKTRILMALSGDVERTSREIAVLLGRPMIAIKPRIAELERAGKVARVGWSPRQPGNSRGPLERLWRITPERTEQ